MRLIYFLVYESPHFYAYGNLGVVRAIPNTDSPQYQELASQGYYNKPVGDGMPQEFSLSDDFVIPPSKRIVEYKPSRSQESGNLGTE